MNMEQIKEEYAKEQGYDSVIEMIRTGTYNPYDTNILMQRAFNAALVEFYKEIYMNDEIVGKPLLKPCEKLDK